LGPVGADVATKLHAISTWLSGFSLGDAYANRLQNLVSLKTMYFPTVPMSQPNQYRIWINGSDTGTTGGKISGRYNFVTLISGFTLEEYFGSFLDYDPYTSISIYLPFSGLHTLSPHDIIGASITLRVGIDWLTGDLTYLILDSKNGMNSVLYRFTGNCATEEPLTSQNYSQQTSSALAFLAGAIGAGVSMYTGNMLGVAAGLGVAAKGAVDTANNMWGKTEYIGKTTGNFGALDVKRPYLIVTRPKMVQADDYGEIYGYPCMKSYKLANVSEYVLVSDWHPAIPGATKEEIDEIDTLVKTEGIIL